MNSSGKGPKTMKTGFLGTPVVRQPLVNPGQQPTETKEQQEQLQQQGGRVALADEPAYEPAVTQEAEVLEAAVKQTSGAKGGPAISDPEAWARNFEQCLALLRGPSDEQRFVGLLLVTKLLPQGSDDAMRKVLDALGLDFLQRLLAPLAQQTPQARDAASSLSPEARQQQLLCCSLALAVLAAACRLPEVAELQDMTQLLPILLKVIESRGLTPILSRPGVKDAPGWSSSNDGSSISSRSSSSSSGNNDEVADASMGEGEFEHAHAVQDAAALSDALECLLALSSTSVASSSTGTDTSEGPNLGPSSLLQAAAVPQTVAACAAVVAAAVVSAPPTAGPAGQHLPAASTSQPAQSVHMRAALLAVTVIGTLLQAPRSFCWEMLTSNPRATAALVAALGHCIGNPLLLVHAGPAGTGASQQTGNASSSIGSNGEGDAAVLQLESLHLLLALLPIITTDAAFSHVQQHLQHAAGRCDESHGWAAAVRRGCAWILQSKATPVQKHSAMQACAVMVCLLGEAWLLCLPTRYSVAAAASHQQDPPDLLLTVLTETLSVETELLLHDALHPERPVAASSMRCAAAGIGADALSGGIGPQPSEALLQELAHRAEQMDLDDGAEDDAGGLHMHTASTQPTVVSAASAPAAASQRLQLEQQQSRKQLQVQVQQPIATAGMRAGRMLPVCFSLWESLVEVVAHEASSPDELSLPIAEEESLPHSEEADMLSVPGPEYQPADAAASSGRGDAAATGAGVQAVVGKKWLLTQHGPVLSESALQRLMAKLSAAIDTILQFLDAANPSSPATLAAASEPEPKPVSAYMPKPMGTAEGAGVVAAGPVGAGAGSGAVAGAVGPDGASSASGVVATATWEAVAQAQLAGSSGACDTAAARVSSEAMQGPVLQGEPPVASQAAAVQHCTTGAAQKPMPPPNLLPSLHVTPSSHVDASLLLGAVRVAGRYLAEAPEAASQALALQVLPYALALGTHQASTNQASMAPEDHTWTVPFLLPGLLQATSASNGASLAIRAALGSSQVALHALASFLEWHTGQASALVKKLEVAVNHSAASRMLMWQDLRHAEQAMADVSMLLLNVLDSLAAGAHAGVVRSDSAAGSDVSMSSCTSSQQQAGSASAGLANAAASSGPAMTQQYTKDQVEGESEVCDGLPWSQVESLTAPAMAALLAWGRQRRASLGLCEWGAGAAGSSSLDLSRSWSSVVSSAVEARLFPRAVLCTGALLGMLTVHAGAHASGGGTASAMLSTACGALLWALQYGAGLHMAVVESEASQEALMPPARHSVSGVGSGMQQGGVLQLDMHQLLDDYIGDAEVCFGRLQGSALALLESFPEMRRKCEQAAWLQALVRQVPQPNGSFQALLIDHGSIEVILRTYASIYA